MSVAAPMGSVNTISAGGALPTGDCIYRYNMIPAEYGLRTRLGSREWVTGLDGEARSLLAFTGSTKDGANNRLFVCTYTGIWDVTSSTAAPTQVVTFPTQDADSGWGASVVMVTAAGHFLLYTDEANGYYVYTESGGTWAKIAQGAGGTEVDNVDPALFVHVMVWKNRVWFTEKDTGRAWYLAAGAIYGAATSFNFGRRFSHGGDLRGLWSWTIDGAAGIDDRLVAVSGGGDVVIYAGTDPDTPGGFELVGVWFIGAVPAGRRIASDFGGDLLVMSSYGLLRVSTLDRGAVSENQYETAKIANLWNKKQTLTRSLRGWSMAIHPEDATLLVTIPVAEGQVTEQLAMSLAGRVWSQYRDLPMGVCAVAWEGTLYFGTPDGRVMRNTGYVDGVTLADPDSYTSIGWSLLTGFNNLGSPVQKQVEFLCPSFLSESAPQYEIAARYRWDLSEISTTPSAADQAGASLWDTATWDSGVWSGEFTPSQRVVGALGMGREVAIAIRGTSASRTILTDIAVDFTTGGFL